jgi:U3 small nucleolar RNA-associated protein 18
MNVTVSLATSSRLHKLRDTPSDDVVGGHEYERRLRRQFERTNPTPEWALRSRRQDRLKRTHGSSSSDEEDGDVNVFFSSAGGIVMSQENKSKGIISQGTLGIERLRDGNQAARSEGEVRVVRFHPSPKVPVLLTAGADRRARLFNVGFLIFNILSSGFKQFKCR